MAKKLPLIEKNILRDLPRRVDRKTGAELVTHHFFPIAARTLEKWPLPWCRVNGKSTCTTAELFDLAESKLADAAPVRTGVR